MGKVHVATVAVLCAISLRYLAMGIPEATNILVDTLGWFMDVQHPSGHSFWPPLERLREHLIENYIVGEGVVSGCRLRCLSTLCDVCRLQNFRVHVGTTVASFMIMPFQIWKVCTCHRYHSSTPAHLQQPALTRANIAPELP